MPEKDKGLRDDAENLKTSSKLREGKTKDEKKLIAGTSLWSEAWRRLRKNKLAIICVVIILIIFSACTIYAIPHLSSLSKKGGFELIVTHVDRGSIAEEAGIKIGDIILKYDNIDVAGYRVTNILVNKIKAKNIKKKAENLPLQTEVQILLNRKIPDTLNNNENVSKFRSFTLTAKIGYLGIHTNEPPVFFQDFSQTTQIKEATNQTPTADHWFGTDNTGRDLFARTLFGGFISFIIGMLATLVASFIGVIYGSIAGYFGGRVDGVMMRIVDILYGLPFLMIIILIKVIADDFKNNPLGGDIFSNIISFILIFFVALIFIWFLVTLIRRLNYRDRIETFVFPQSLLTTLLIALTVLIVFQISQFWVTFDTSSEWFGFMLTFVILGMYAWLTMARIARGQMLEVRSKDYVTAARALGATPTRIIFKHSIPNILGPVIIYATINIPAVILLEAFLSFLGLGISEPYCSWGTLANDGFKTLSFLGTNWWLIVFPGGIMAISLFALNFLGDGIRDAIDPRMR